MKLVLIAAHDPDLVIGAQGRLPWHYPEDLKHFKARTLGHPVVMGRGVYDELGGRLLPKRRNIVISSRPLGGVEQFSSPEAALDVLSGEAVVYIIGGAKLYTAVLPLADRLEITQVHQKHTGDVYFPEYRPQIGTVWREVARTEGDGLTFLDYDRIR